MISKLKKNIMDIKFEKMKDENIILSTLNEFLDKLDNGKIRVVNKIDNKYIVNEWVKDGILLIFKYFKMKKIFNPFLENVSQSQNIDKNINNTNNSNVNNKKMNNKFIGFFDKIDIKGSDGSFRFVPGGSSIRRGSFIGKGTIVMPPTFINIGAYIDENTMIDSTTLVGSCAQIGKHCHISAGTILGGVLEPLNATPVIIEDNCFIGGNCGIYEGVIIEKNSIIGTGTIINGSTPIIDVETGKKYYKRVPEGSVVIPGGKKKTINGEEYIFQTPLIIKKRKDISDSSKVELNELLRDFL